MIDTNQIYVIIPAYQEAAVLRDNLRPVIELGYSVIVVDDGSTDGTASQLTSLPIHVLRHSVNLGQGAALQTGMDYALRCGAEIAIHFDADGQHDPRQIQDLIRPILEGKADIVFGSRFLRSEDRDEVPISKRIALRFAIMVSGLLAGLWLKDSHNGFRALSRTALERIHLEETGFAHATEILDKVRRAKLRYVEVPVTVKYSNYSRAKGQPLSNGLNIILDLLLGRVFR